MSTFTTFFLLFAILVYQVLFFIIALKEKSKFFKVVNYVNVPFILLNVFTIGTFF